MKLPQKITTLLALLLLLPIGASQAEGQFPMREVYPGITIIELKALHDKFDDYLIVDVRSAYEYETLHIKGARHIGIDDQSFTSQVRKLRKESAKPIVFYCNGHTCKKSYKAAQRAESHHVDNVIAYDAGIFDWSKAYPDMAVLLGKSPVAVNRLISKKTFEQHLLEPDAFAELAHGESIVIDIRDYAQKESINLFPMKQRSAPLDNKRIQSYVDKAKASGKPLLVYDAVGKQVRWLQYYLEEQGLKNYYFMKGGAKAFLKS